MELSESRYADFPLLVVHGEVDHAAGDALRALSSRALGEEDRIALDLSDCPLMDSGGISVLLSLLGRVRPHGVLAVIAPDPDLLRIFEIVGLTRDASFRALASTDELAALGA